MSASRRMWRMPLLNREGQQVFWDRQAQTYALADMTNDNLSELEIVDRLCVEFAERGFVAEDVVTLGGATGCRDPLVVMRSLRRCGQHVFNITFNDLSLAMVEQARALLVATLGVEMRSVVGPIHEISSLITPVPRRVILGLYSVGGFMYPQEALGYPCSGIVEYVRNAATIGEHLFVDIVGVEGGVYRNLGVRLSVSATHADDDVPKLLQELEGREHLMLGSVLRVVGQHANLPGFFLSHWFSERSVRQLLDACLEAERLHTLRLFPCPKGFVVCIDPIDRPRGIVTVLNNVIGNVLPDEQFDTLRAVARMSK